jgi:hypothetical protein
MTYLHAGIVIADSGQSARMLVANNNMVCVLFQWGIPALIIDVAKAKAAAVNNTIDIATASGVSTTISSDVQGLAISANNVLVASGSNIEIWDVSTPLNAVRTKVINTGQGIYGVFTDSAGQYIAVNYDTSTFFANVNYNVTDRWVALYDSTGNKLWNYEWPGDPRMDLPAYDPYNKVYQPTDAFCEDDTRNNYLGLVQSVVFLRDGIAVGQRRGTVTFFSYSGQVIGNFPSLSQKIGSGCSSNAPYTSNGANEASTQLATDGQTILGIAFQDAWVEFVSLNGTSIIDLGTYPYTTDVGGYARSIFIAPGGSIASISLGYMGLVLVNISSRMRIGNRWEGYDRVWSVKLSTDLNYAYIGGDAIFSVFNIATQQVAGFTADHYPDGSIHPCRSWASQTIDRRRALSIVPDTWCGLRINDVKDPNNPKYLLQSCCGSGFRTVTSSLYVDAVSDVIGINRVFIHSGGYLALIDYTNASSPTLVSQVNTGSDFSDIGLSPDGKYAYLAAGSNIIVVDISTISSMKVIGTIAVPNTINQLRVFGNRIWATVYTYGLYSLDISNPASPILNPTPFDPFHGYGPGGLAQLNSTTLIMGCGSVLAKIDITNPIAPTVIESVTIPGADLVFIDYFGGEIVVSTFSIGIRIFIDPSIIPPPTLYDCTGAPDYICYPATGGTFTKYTACQSACKIPPPPPPPNNTGLVGLGLFLLLISSAVAIAYFSDNNQPELPARRP